MGIMTRMVRLFKADLHGVIDHLEDQGLLLKQCLREMEDEVSRQENHLKAAIVSRDQAQKALNKVEEEKKKLNQDLDLALEKNKDDIARFLIRKLRVQSGREETLRRQIKDLDQDAVVLRDYVERRRNEYEDLKIRAAEYFQEEERRQWESRNIEAALGPAPDLPSADLEVELELLARKEALGKRAGQ